MKVRLGIKMAVTLARRRLRGVIQIPVLCSLLLLSRLAPRVGAACNRSIHLDGYVTSEYPANNPIEDRHAVVEASGKCTVIYSRIT